jgi:predicted O-methyltransferase YrrM
VLIGPPPCQAGNVTCVRQPDREIALGRVREVLDRLVRDGTAVARLDGTVHRLFPVAVGPAEGTAIRSWVIQEAAVRTIEVGLGYGVSALFACEGLLANGGPDARHVVIDPNQDTRFAGCGLQFLEEAGVAGLVEYHAEESQVTLPRLVSEGCRFDLAVVDGNHRFDAVFLDLAYLGRLLRPGGIVFVDDYHLPGIARAVSFFLTNLGWSLEEVSTAEDHHHWAVLRTSVKPDTRPFDYFADF